MGELISPVAMGLISDPPTIVVSYDCISKSGERRKRRKRKMPLRDFTDRSNVKRYAFNLRQRHSKYLADVIDVTLEKMLRIIQEIQKGSSVEESLIIVNKEYSIDPEEDLNKLSPAQLAQRKAVMEETFHKNLVKPGDADFVYDREVKFDAKSEASDDGNDWDDESDKLKKYPNNAPPLQKDENERTQTFLPTHEVDRRDKETPEIICQTQFKEINEEENIREKEIDVDEGSSIDFKDKQTNSSKFSNSDGNAQKQSSTSSFFNNPLPSNEETVQKSYEESSSTNDIEEALVNIEVGALDDEEEEDFWQ